MRQDEDNAGRFTTRASQAVGHVTGEFLALTETFIYTTVRFQRDFSPVVLARRRANADAFPFEPIFELVAANSWAGAQVVDRLRAKASRYPGIFEWRLKRVAERQGCVLLHAHFGVVGYLSLVPGRRLGVPVVTTFYGWDLAVARPQSPWTRRYVRLFNEGSLFVCEGPVMREHLIRLGCPDHKIRVVRIGVDISNIQFRPKPPGDHLTLLQVARLVEKKGVDIAIRAFAAAQSRARLADLIIVGEGPERRRLEILARELGVADHVRFLGALSYDEYQRVLAGADIGIQPSRLADDGDTEGGAPTVLIEMQAAGLPIVGTRHADIPFVVAHPDNLVDEEDVGGLAAVLSRLADTPTSVWARRAVEARAFVERHHDAPRVAEQIAAVYREVLAESLNVGPRNGRRRSPRESTQPRSVPPVSSGPQ